MTADEWETETDPVQLIRSQAERRGLARERRLILAQIARNLFGGEKRFKDTIELVERTADGDASTDERRTMAAWVRKLTPYTERLLGYSILADALLKDVSPGNVEHVVAQFAELGRDSPAFLAAIIRDILGNPFRTVTFDPAWRTLTSTAIASRMYESRSFDLVPVLGDALEDAGCENAGVLGHCRDPEGVHVRGCWVVDLVLGKK